jgi:hypothetical protein
MGVEILGQERQRFAEEPPRRRVSFISLNLLVFMVSVRRTDFAERAS